LVAIRDRIDSFATGNSSGEAMLLIEIENLKKEKSRLEAEIRKVEKECQSLDAKNRAISEELLERMRQLVDVQNRQLGVT
jgi:type IV secretory pathway VirB4 component